MGLPAHRSKPTLVIAGLLALAGAVYGGYRLRVRSLEARGRELERQVEASPVVEGDAGQLHQVVLNLVTNFTGFVPLGTVLVALLGAACGSDSGEPAEAGQGPDELPTVVVTTSILGDVVSNLLGESATVETIMPTGSVRARSACSTGWPRSTRTDAGRCVLCLLTANASPRLRPSTATAFSYSN